VTNLLRNAGHDVVETREWGPDPGDFGIMQIAVREERILVTADSDFATLALRHGAAHHGIIELPQTSVEDLAAIVARILDARPPRRAADRHSGDRYRDAAPLLSGDAERGLNR